MCVTPIPFEMRQLSVPRWGNKEDRRRGIRPTSSMPITQRRLQRARQCRACEDGVFRLTTSGQAVCVTSAVISDGRHLDDAAHFEQTRAGAQDRCVPHSVVRWCRYFSGTRAFICDVTGVGIDQICCGDEWLAVVAARGDDRRDGVFHPVGDAVGPEIVEQQDFLFHRDAIGFAIAGHAMWKVVSWTECDRAGSLVIEEETFEPFGEDGPKRGDSQMRLARARVAHQQ